MCSIFFSNTPIFAFRGHGTNLAVSSFLDNEPIYSLKFDHKIHSLEVRLEFSHHDHVLHDLVGLRLVMTLFYSQLEICLISCTKSCSLKCHLMRWWFRQQNTKSFGTRATCKYVLFIISQMFVFHNVKCTLHNRLPLACAFGYKVLGKLYDSMCSKWRYHSPIYTRNIYISFKHFYKCMPSMPFSTS